MKSVLISIHPKWVHKILDREKTIEVRKTRPKIETPFKCYIYCTKGDEVLPYHDYCGFDMEDFSGDFVANMKVVAEFTCHAITPIRVSINGTIQNWMCYGLEKSCVPYDNIVKYIGNNQSGYGWHISGLKVYDKPKEIGDFKVRQTNEIWSFTKKLERPPQSWCYVEDMERGGENAAD